MTGVDAARIGIYCHSLDEEQDQALYYDSIAVMHALTMATQHNHNQSERIGMEHTPRAADASRPGSARRMITTLGSGISSHHPPMAARMLESDLPRTQSPECLQSRGPAGISAQHSTHLANVPCADGTGAGRLTIAGIRDYVSGSMDITIYLSIYGPYVRVSQPGHRT
ncbi:hypothetical protein BD413DRAFT_517545 [Trametes elegans]|nr:hypothetical protein BD413DRAFT_517545 [Trametes elegans]